jgi:hypothetical protein
VFENRVLMIIFGPKRDVVTTDSRKLLSDKIYNLYSSPSIIRIVKSRRSWEVFVARMGRRELHIGY